MGLLIMMKWNFMVLINSIFISFFFMIFDIILLCDDLFLISYEIIFECDVFLCGLELIIFDYNNVGGFGVMFIRVDIKVDGLRNIILRF